MAGEGEMEISLDKLPIKRLDYIEESGVERFPPAIGYEEKTVNLIRRIDFAWAVERDTKKKKKAKEASGPSTWQGLVENLQLAHQELSVIIDLINTVEANDAVAVAGMNRPKPLPNEVLSDLAVSAATKLQCYRVLPSAFLLKCAFLFSSIILIYIVVEICVVATKLCLTMCNSVFRLLGND